MRGDCFLVNNITSLMPVTNNTSKIQVQEVIVHFVDSGGIDDHHCLEVIVRFFFILGE